MFGFLFRQYQPPQARPFKPEHNATQCLHRTVAVWSVEQRGSKGLGQPRRGSGILPRNSRLDVGRLGCDNVEKRYPNLTPNAGVEVGHTVAFRMPLLVWGRLTGAGREQE